MLAFCVVVFFFFKQKTAYEMRISDWSSDVCSSDLADLVARLGVERAQTSGIIFIDEIDKIAGREKGHGPDVSREGVQRDILPIVWPPSRSRDRKSVV